MVLSFFFRRPIELSFILLVIQETDFTGGGFLTTSYQTAYSLLQRLVARAAAHNRWGEHRRLRGTRGGRLVGGLRGLQDHRVGIEGGCAKGKPGKEVSIAGGGEGSWGISSRHATSASSPSALVLTPAPAAQSTTLKVN